MKPVLIVDDNLTQSLCFEEMVRKSGYQCQEVENRAMALAMILTNNDESSEPSPLRKISGPY